MPVAGEAPGAMDVEQTPSPIQTGPAVEARAVEVVREGMDLDAAGGGSGPRAAVSASHTPIEKVLDPIAGGAFTEMAATQKEAAGGALVEGSAVPPPAAAPSAVPPPSAAPLGAAVVAASAPPSGGGGAPPPPPASESGPSGPSDEVVPCRPSSFDALSHLASLPYRQSLVLRGHSSAVCSVRFDRAGGRVVSASADGTVCLWRLSDGALLARIRHARKRREHGVEVPGGVSDACWLPAVDVVATGGDDGVVRLWRLAGPFQGEPGAAAARGKLAKGAAKRPSSEGEPAAGADEPGNHGELGAEDKGDGDKTEAGKDNTDEGVVKPDGAGDGGGRGSGAASAEVSTEMDEDPPIDAADDADATGGAIEDSHVAVAANGVSAAAPAAGDANGVSAAAPATGDADGVPDDAAAAPTAPPSAAATPTAPPAAAASGADPVASGALEALASSAKGEGEEGEDDDEDADSAAAGALGATRRPSSASASASASAPPASSSRPGSASAQRPRKKSKRERKRGRREADRLRRERKKKDGEGEGGAGGGGEGEGEGEGGEGGEGDDAAAALFSTPPLFSYALVGTLRAHTHAVTSLDASPLGSLLASASFDETVVLWSVADCSPLRAIPAHSDPVMSVRFAPADAARPVLVSASLDGVVRVWDALGGRCLASLLAPKQAPATWAGFSGNGRLILSSHVDVPEEIPTQDGQTAQGKEERKEEDTKAKGEKVDPNAAKTTTPGPPRAPPAAPEAVIWQLPEKRLVRTCRVPRRGGGDAEGAPAASASAPLLADGSPAPSNRASPPISAARYYQTCRAGALFQDASGRLLALTTGPEHALHAWDLNAPADAADDAKQAWASPEPRHVGVLRGRPREGGEKGREQGQTPQQQQTGPTPDASSGRSTPETAQRPSSSETAAPADTEMAQTDASMPAETQEPWGHSDVILGLDVSADGVIATSAHDRDPTVRIWQPEPMMQDASAA